MNNLSRRIKKIGFVSHSSVGVFAIEIRFRVEHLKLSSMVVGRKFRTGWSQFELVASPWAERKP